MENMQEKIYAITNQASKSRYLTKILTRAYRENLDRAYEVLVALPNESDRIRLLNYVDKQPRLSAKTVQKIVDIYMFYRVTVKNNPEYKRTFMRNNPRCAEHQHFHQMRKLRTILERAYDYNIEHVQKILDVLPNEQDKLKLLKYIDKTPYLSNKSIRKMVQIYVIYNIDLRRPNNQEDRKIKPAKTGTELFKEREERDLILSYWADLHFISQR